MPRIEPTDRNTDSFYAVLGNRPEIADAWAALDKVMLTDSSSTLSTALKEEVRSGLAQGIGCQYCATVGGAHSTEHLDPRASLAGAFAEQVVNNLGKIDDSMFEVLRGEFSNDEIVELCAWICFKLGANVLGALMKLDPATEEQSSAYLGLLDDAGVR
ncbi:carboxymuconolactone decarboxylase family protein [Mycolicibacterium mengxianglii]|uniref:carboxymuconolactone decarboxylase family protein n=1 Tax=Mycolicibacterium mengxianglii TaxID=2736649 RepID=UPI0018D0C36C|nr:carboxymuconolactone decarboxylase family protein [Mycolicibacterium mengxianglii]